MHSDYAWLCLMQIAGDYKIAITANQDEKIAVKIATQQKQINLASPTSIDKTVVNGAAETLASFQSVNNGSSYSHSNSNKSQQQFHQQQQRLYSKPQYNNSNNNNHYNNGFQKQQQQQQQENNQQNKNSSFITNIKDNQNYKNIGNLKENDDNVDVVKQPFSTYKVDSFNGQLNGDKKYNKNDNNVGVNNTSTSENFSYGFSKNFAKIRQHDSDVSPRPRRPYQNDSSSRYYNKSSDGTGQGRIINTDNPNPRNIPASIGEGGGGGGGGGGRRPYINTNTDYNNSLNQSIGYNNRSLTPPDPIKGGGFNNSINNSNTNNIGGGQHGGSYINKNNVRSNLPYQQQQQQQQYGSYNNRYNNGRENNYYNKYNENGGGGGVGGRPQYNRGIGNNTIGDIRDYSPSVSPNLNGGPRLGQSQRGNPGGENNRGLPNNINNRGPSSQYDNNGQRRTIHNSGNNNYNNFDKTDRIDRSDRDRDRGSERFDRDRTGFDRNDRPERIERGGINGPLDRPDRDRIIPDRFNSERLPSDRLDRNERERLGRPLERFDRDSRSERGALPPSVLRPDSRPPLIPENINNSGRPTYQGRDSGNYSPQSLSASPISGSPKRADIRGNGGTSKSETKNVDRWIPPSLRPQHALTESDKNDAVFRKVRGILNKLTPEKFQDLCEDLLQIDLTSTAILNGVILLIFDKALDEPKYSSMYAQLCKRLNDEAANIEENSKQPTKFISLLLNVCRDKFLNRSLTSNPNNNNIKNSNTNNSKNSEINKFDTKTLSEKDKEYYNKENDDEIKSEEEEKRHVAKQRMLGNVKFIAELFKLQMLSPGRIHICIQDLFDRKKEPDAGLQDWCEDMECLCQLIRTCGKDMDTEPSKKLMDQYITEMDKRSKSTEYPPRIRFMLRDIIELRENTWVPRKVVATEGPVPIRQIRTDDDNLIRPPYINRNRDMRNDRDSDHWMNRLTLNLQPSNFNDMFGGLSVTGASPLMSPGGGYNNRNQRNNQNNYNNYNNRYNKHNNNQLNIHNNGNGLSGNNQFNHILNNKDIAPRFKKSLIATAPESIENIQMRPQTNSLLFKANMSIKPPMLPISTSLSSSGGNLSSNGNSTISNSAGLGQNNILTSQQFSTSNNKLDNLNISSNNNSGHVISVSAPPSNRNSSGSNISTSNESSFRSSSTHGVKPITVSPNPSSLVNNSIVNDEVMLVTKNGSTEKTRGKKDKGPGKEEMIKRVVIFVQENIIGVNTKESSTAVTDQNNEEKEQGEKPFENDDSSTTNDENNCDDKLSKQIYDEDTDDSSKTMEDIVTLFYEMKIQDKYMKDITYAIINEVLDKSDQDHENVIQFLQQLRRDNKLQSNSLLEAFRQIINKMNEKEVTIPRITTIVASLLARSVMIKLCKLSDVSVYTEGGQHYPLLLLVLQQLHKTMGRDPLEELFQKSKVNLMTSLPEADRNKDRLAIILEGRNLTFLYPLLKVQQELLKQIESEDNPQLFYKWIKTNVDSKYHKNAGFITALMTVILKYVTQDTTLVEGTDIKKIPEKSIIEKEESLFHKYCHILEALLFGNTQLQLTALYALQVFCYSAEFPKGMLYRWFKNLYETNVIEEEAFFRWKEEVTDEYPGKGTALFQVNQWLTWLETAESEDED